MTAFVVAAGRRHLPRGWLDLGRQLAIWFGFLALYQVARGVADRNPTRAFENGLGVINIEERVGDLFEVTLANLVAGLALPDVPRLVDVLELRVHGRRADAAVRLPAPARRTSPLPELDPAREPDRPGRLRRRCRRRRRGCSRRSASRHARRVGGLNHGSGLVELAANPYAAMPSLHAADALIVGITLAIVCRRWWSKTIWLLWPAWVWFAVMATGNHFWLDILAGIVVVRARGGRDLPAAALAAAPPGHGDGTGLRSSGTSVKATYTDGARRLASRSITGLARTRGDAVDADRRGRHAVRARGSCSSTSSTRTSGCSSGPARSCSCSARCSTSSTARWRAPAASRRSFGAFLDSTTDRIGEAFMLGAIAGGIRPRRQRDRVPVHLRGDRRVVPRLVHALEGGGARPARRRRHRLARRAGGRDHPRPGLRPVGRPAVGDLLARGDGVDHGRAAHLVRAQAAPRTAARASTSLLSC